MFFLARTTKNTNINYLRNRNSNAENLWCRNDKLCDSLNDHTVSVEEIVKSLEGIGHEGVFWHHYTVPCRG